MEGATKKINSQGGLLNFVGPFWKTGLCVLVPLRLAASAPNAAIQKKIFGSCVTALIISNKEMDDIMKIKKRQVYC